MMPLDPQFVNQDFGKSHFRNPRNIGSGIRPVFSCRPVLRLWLLTIFFCLSGSPAPAAAPAAPLCLDGQLLLVPGPENSQMAAIFASLNQSFALPAIGAAEIRFRPGRGGSYALRDIALEKADGCRQAGLVLPSLFYLQRSPESMVAGDGVTVTAVSASADNALWVAEEGPLRSWPDFLARARKLAGDRAAYLSIAGTGSYTDQHMATLQLNRAAGIRAEYIPLLGSAEAAGAVRAGKADACWGYALDPENMPGMTALAVAGEERSPALPDVPTFRELGIDLINSAHFAFALPSATPQKRQAALTPYRMRGGNDAPPLLKGLRRVKFYPPQLPVFLENADAQAEDDLQNYLLLPYAAPRIPAR